MSITAASPSPLLTTHDVAEILDCSPRTVGRLRDRGELRAVRVSARLVRFARDDVAAFVERGRRRDEPIDAQPHPIRPDELTWDDDAQR